MKENLSKRLWLVFHAVIVSISLMDAAVYLSMRSIWFFINKAVAGGSGGKSPVAFLFFILFMAALLYSLFLFIKCLQKNDFKRPKIINIVLPVVLAAIFTLIDLYLFIQLGNSQNIVLRNLVEALPWILAILFIVFFVIIYPGLKISRRKELRYGAAAVFLVVILACSPDFGGVRITSGPVIQLLDDSHLSVIWTTNKNSTAYVEFGPDENHLERVASSHNGIIDANTTVHKVILPVDEQSEFIYRVVSTKINHYYQNSVEYGNTVNSSFKKYKDYRVDEKITFYVLNDIHENIDLYKDFLSKDDYDFVVLNGDIVNSIDSPQVIVDKILKPLSISTGGTRPFYLVRGNHETRGASARDLTDYISLPENSFYYTFHAGPIFSVVLDSAEDKFDSHEEYSGLADFEKYMGTETAWLQALSQSEAYKNAKYKIAFVHIPLNDYNGQDDTSYLKINQQKWRDALNSMKINAAFSGHTHTSMMLEQDNINFTFNNFIGGGDSLIEKEFLAIKAEVTEESMKVYYIDTDGEVVNEYVVGDS